MKFKTKEELIDKNQDSKEYTISAECGINDSFNSFKERIDFYKKHECTGPFKGGYAEHLGKIAKENPELHHKFLKEITNKKSIFWNAWLYQYYFGDI